MILDDITAKTRLRLEAAKKRLPPELIRERALAKAAEDGPGSGAEDGAALPFARALGAPGLSFICEVKRASPSKGLIAADFPYLQIAAGYEAAGAAAVSVLTEPEFFLGRDEYLRDIAAALRIPALRKDFIIDDYQIYEAKLLGASAVLLICALLDTETLAGYIAAARSLGMDALVEIHDEAEAGRALESGAGIIGINNRDLRTFTVDLGLTARLRKLLPPDRIVVAESGIKGPADVRGLAGIDAVLVGESLMRATDKKRFLESLRAASREVPA